MSTTRLLDVNVLVALLWPPHEHHLRAQAWFSGVREQGWATCPITQLGAVRVLSRPGISHGTMTVASATAALVEILSADSHLFWPADIDFLTTPLRESIVHIQGPGQLTDQYLLALAAAHGGTFATFDRRVGAALPPGSPLLQQLEFVPA
ncbi:MAG: PIN domain-containing protein [Chloroflexi bacterium]|nr:PIN domain-containing protein [Chloroflexota bacterium]